jgi:Ca2+-binding EF-hand superfamily protein
MGKDTPPAFGMERPTMYGSVGGSDRLLRQMDTNMNGTVSKHEFLRFVGQNFEHLDTNRNGRLERHELRALVGGRSHLILTPPR